LNPALTAYHCTYLLTVETSAAFIEETTKMKTVVEKSQYSLNVTKNSTENDDDK